MFKRSTKAASPLKRLIAAAAVPVLILAIFLDSASTEAKAFYAINDIELLRAEAVEPEGNVFITDDSAGLIAQKDGRDLPLTAGQAVTVNYQGETISVLAREESVSGLLARLDIRPSPLEMTSVSLREDALEIEIASEFIFYESVSTVVEHETIYEYNDKLPESHEAVIQEGQDGAHLEVYEVIYQDGGETARQLIDVVETEAIPTIIEIGTGTTSTKDVGEASIVTNPDGTGTITLASGEELHFSEAKAMKGTAYTTGGKVGTITASGTQVRVGVVAVDRKVIPLGTKVYVVSNDGQYVYGYAAAEDTGVKGNIIDLYMNTYDECIQFGVRNCTVYILD